MDRNSEMLQLLQTAVVSYTFLVGYYTTTTYIFFYCIYLTWCAPVPDLALTHALLHLVQILLTVMLEMDTCYLQLSSWTQSQSFKMCIIFFLLKGDPKGLIPSLLSMLITSNFNVMTPICKIKN